MSLAGTYILSSNENFEAWLKAAGGSDEQVSKAMKVKLTLVIADTASGITVTTKAGDKEFTNTITYGQESAMEVGGVKYTMNVSKTASGYEGTISAKDKTGKVSCSVSGSTLTRTFTLGDVTAKRIFTKQ
ncbi:Calycin [Trinorchestia longiramus]|nr:Calycin [Trinorchestia longiramus]